MLLESWMAVSDVFAETWFIVGALLISIVVSRVREVIRKRKAQQRARLAWRRYYSEKAEREIKSIESARRYREMQKAA